MPSVIINNLFKINELIKLGDPKLSGKTIRSEDEPKIHRNILFERKIIQIKCKYQVVSEFAKKNYFLQLHEGTGWDIYWTDKQFLSVRHMKSMMPYQRINYFPGMSILTNKQNLTQRLNLYKQLFPQEYDFFPKTWVVDKHTDIPNLMQEKQNSEVGQEDISDFLDKREVARDIALVKEPQIHNAEKLNEPLRDKTNNYDITKDRVLKEFIQDWAPPQKGETTSGEHTSDNVNKVERNPDDTSVNEINDQFAEVNNESNKENENPRELDTEMKLKDLGIKTNNITKPNLKSAPTNKRSNPRHLMEIPDAPNVLLRDNVKNMVMALNRMNQTVKTVNRWKNVVKENEGNREHDGHEDKVREKSPDEEITDKENVQVENKTIDMITKVTNDDKTLDVKSKPIYILKPCDGCQGKGIQLAMNIRNAIDNMEFDAMICQQYITNPLLWNGYKFDIRFYVLVTSVKHLRVYVYNEGIVRLATEKYEEPNEDNIGNMFMHLTNYSINKNSENFNEDLSKQSLERMNKFLEDEHGVDLKVLYGKINNIIVKTILTGYKSMLREYLDTFKNYVYREACFQLLGFDIILDNQCNPYLLEINKNASLKRPTAIDKLIKTKLTKNLFGILNLNEGRLRGDILRDNLNYNAYKKYNLEPEIKNRGDFSMIYPCIGLEEYARYMID